MPQWKQFSGQWTVTQAAQAKGAGTWPTLPSAPTIGTATAGDAEVSVAFTAPTTGYPTTFSFTATSSPGGVTATGSASPVVVTGLSNGTSYTFTVTATNNTGTGPASAASNSAIPVAPTELYAWGYNPNGELGLNNTSSVSSPTQVGALTTWLSVDTWYHTTALQTNGTLWTWGRGAQGRLGINSIINKSSPTQVGSSTWAYATIGGNYSLAISSAGNLYAWGANSDGQLGVNNTVTTSSPVQIGALTTWLQLTAGYNHSFGILSTNAMYSWGSNNQGILGQGYTGGASISSPTQVGALTNWLQVDAGGNYNCAAVKTDGTLWSWGTNDYGLLGQPGASNPTNSPAQVGALTNWAQVSEGYQTCMAVKTDGTLWAWGRNSSGQFGNNTRVDRNSPVQAGSDTDWAAVGCGNGSTIAVKTNGTLWVWGANSNGVGGQNTSSSASRSSPYQVGALTTWTKVNISRWSDGIAFAIKTT